MKRLLNPSWILMLLSVLLFTGCKGPELTAVNLDPNSKEPEGIPYYLPKPYLFVSKNVRYIYAPILGPSTAITGTTPNGDSGNSNTKSNQINSVSKNGTDKTGTNKTNSLSDVINSLEGAMNTSGHVTPSANTNASQQSGSPTSSGTGQSQDLSAVAVVPPASTSDGLVPQEFFTYQIIYLPDTTQKYGLRIKGSSGELKATADLVNGWMFTGPGPFDISDSTTAQDVTATGQAIGSVAQAAGQIALNALGIPSLGGASNSSGGATTTAAGPINSTLGPIQSYAQIYVFDFIYTKGLWKLRPLNGGKPIVDMTRDALAFEQQTPQSAPGSPAPNSAVNPQLADKMVNYITNALSTIWSFPQKPDVSGNKIPGLSINILPNIAANNGTVVALTISHVSWASGATQIPDMDSAIQTLKGDVNKAANDYLNHNPKLLTNATVSLTSLITSIPQ